ncbi:hypothetical protein M983_2055 [Proteus myxofaciens ATCC 19692]|uniref:Uncharacterized protein n=1 Tax=Proteus myxofaciens ATCC 19692 TaxID=1354337 RepID=A0A198FQB3_9GAMM|nr:hypothetical protein M983_2055 [Proteus myxofaciens ATCC 19692]
MKIADIEYLNNIPLSRCVGRLIRMMRIQKGLTGSELAK